MGLFNIFRSRTTTNRADKIADFTVATAEYGSAVPEILGTTRIGGNVLYYDDFTAHEHRETHRAGKGGRHKIVNITYTYTVAAILGLCEGPISGIGRVWIGKNVFDYPNETIGLSLFKGEENQVPWAYVQGKHPEKALPYSGLAYMAGVIELGESAAFPNYTFEVKGKLLNTGDGVDVNPADYVRYVLDKVGLGDVHIEGLENYRKYCRESDLLISTPAGDLGAKSAHEIINDIMSLTNSYMFWSNNRFKIVPLEDRPVGSWKPNTTIMYNLSADDFLEQSNGALVVYERKDSSEVYNQFPVEFINRANSYERETVAYALTEDIKNFGVRQASSLKAHYFYTKARAVKVAEMWARRVKYGRNRYTFKLDWAFCRLEVGDLVTLTDNACGIENELVVINGIKEDEHGLLTITAVSRPPMTLTPAKFNVHEVDRPFVDYNIQPSDTDTPVIVQPPADLTNTGFELWVGAKGKTDGWGGCTAYVSDDNTNYRRLGQISNTARLGVLTAGVGETDTSITVKSNGTFLSGTKQDAERGNTLCWLDGECLSYQTATMLSNGDYKLDGCIRGQYNTAAASHNTGARFARLDDTLLKAPYLKEDIGKTVYLKFCSYNVFGANEQDIAAVEPVKYKIQRYYIPNVSSVVAYNRYRQQNDGVSRYDIVVGWDKPNITSYKECQVWYKTNHQQSFALNKAIPEGVKADDIGFSGDWIFGGSGVTQVVIPQAVVGDKYKIAVCTVDQFGEMNTPDTSPQTEILVALKTTIPNTPDGLTIAFGQSAELTWSEATNTDVAFYEIRLDINAGVENSNLLARTNSVKANVNLVNRSGKIYLFAKNALGKYSLPATIDYNKPIPPRPKAPVLTATLGGFGVTADSIPNGCIGMSLYIDSKDAIRTPNNVLSYTCGAGIYGVRIAYYDLFGEGEKSEAKLVTVKVEIDGDMLKREAISLEHINSKVKEKIEAGETAQELVRVVTENLNDPKKAKNYSAISQLSNDINLRVKKGDVINQINISENGVLIDGSKVHVTGDTVFENNVITRGMIQAGAVTADKMLVGNSEGARLALRNNLIEVYDDNNVLRVKLGVWDE